MSLDCSNHRHLAGLDDRAYRSRRKDVQSLYAADDGSGWVPRTGSGDDRHCNRVAMGTRGRHPVAFWVGFVCGFSNAPSQRAELVCECPRFTWAALHSRGIFEALQRQAPTGLTRAASGPQCPHNASAIHPMTSMSRPQYCSRRGARAGARRHSQTHWVAPDREDVMALSNRGLSRCCPGHGSRSGFMVLEPRCNDTGGFSMYPRQT